MNELFSLEVDYDINYFEKYITMVMRKITFVFIFIGLFIIGFGYLMFSKNGSLSGLILMIVGVGFPWLERKNIIDKTKKLWKDTHSESSKLKITICEEGFVTEYEGNIRELKYRSFNGAFETNDDFVFIFENEDGFYIEKNKCPEEIISLLKKKIKVVGM